MFSSSSAKLEMCNEHFDSKRDCNSEQNSPRRNYTRLTTKAQSLPLCNIMTQNKNSDPIDILCIHKISTQVTTPKIQNVFTCRCRIRNSKDIILETTC